MGTWSGSHARWASTISLLATLRSSLLSDGWERHAAIWTRRSALGAFSLWMAALVVQALAAARERAQFDNAAVSL